MVSYWVRLMGAAVGALAMGWAASSGVATAGDQKLHLAAAPADFPDENTTAARTVGSTRTADTG